MSIITHRGGLFLGRQSDAIVTTGLIGNFIPTAGIETHFWENEWDDADALNLRRFNGITHSTTDPDHFLLDGTDDYLGMAGGAGYGGDPLEIGGDTRPFALGQWFKYNNVNHYIFYVGTDAYVSLADPPAGEYSYVLLEVLTSNDQCKLTLRPPYDGTVRSVTATFSNFTFVDDTWYYVTLSHDGANDYSVYVNGSFIGSITSTYALSYSSGTNAVECGAKNIGGSKSYSGAGTKIGHVHVYENAYLTGSQVRQNFLASHDIHDGRIYGATYGA
jgi:hypothetical protein